MKLKRKIILSSIFLSIFSLASFFVYKEYVNAQQGETGYTVELSPAKVNLTIEPGETFEQEFRIGNYSGEKKTFYVYVQDYTVINEQGTPTFFENNYAEDPEANRYALSQWLNVPLESITLDNNQVGTINVAIEIPENAEAGGHYGAFFVQTDSPQREDGTAIGSIGRIASIMLVNVPGDINEEIVITEAYTDKQIYWIDEPTVEFVTMLKNEGNVHGIPIGAFNIGGGMGFKNRSVIYNQAQGAVLPGAPERMISESFTMKKDGLVPPIGKFTVDLIARYGTTEPLPLETTIFFWVLPIKFITITVLGTIVVLFIVWRALVSFKKK